MIDLRRILAHSIASQKHLDVIADVLGAALDAADPLRRVEDHLDFTTGTLVVGDVLYELSPDARLVIVSLGKAAPAMTRGAIDRIKNRYSHGVCVSKHTPVADPTWERIELVRGNHPVPGSGSMAAGEAIRRAVSGLNENDLVLLLLSGGGSSLAVLPVEGISLEDLSALTTALLRSGATINEMNTVRKHIDLVKGGGLLRMASPARVAALVISDVVGNKLDVIASGPAYPDPSTYAEALEIVAAAGKYGTIADGILNHLKKGAAGDIPETLKPGDALANNAIHRIIASNSISCKAAAEAACRRGVSTEVVTTALIGEARQAGMLIASAARSNIGRERPCLQIFGGETTVKVTGSGTGGRNLELALGVVEEMAGMHDMYIVTLATDGEDGPTDAAGAVVSGNTMEIAQSLDLKPSGYLENNDAYSFFKKTGNLLVTGPTGTNVNDISFIFGF